MVKAERRLVGRVGQQLGEGALGHDQVGQVGTIVGFGLLVILLHLAHFFLQLSICSMGAVFFSRSPGLRSARCSGGVTLSRASAWATAMVLLAIISATASTWHAAFMLRGMRVPSGVKCLSCSSSMASGQKPSSRLMRRLVELSLTLNDRTRHSLLTHRWTARRIMHSIDRCCTACRKDCRCQSGKGSVWRKTCAIAATDVCPNGRKE